MSVVNSVSGPVEAGSLGRTLMHEHLVFGYPGHEGDRTMWQIPDEALVRRGVAAVRAAQAQGFSTLFEVTPNDCGRNPQLLRRIAEETGFTVLCATGYYYEGEGGAPYFTFRSLFTDIVAELSDLMVAELTDGIAGTGIRAGVIKLGTSQDRITDYEHALIKAAARAQQATGAPIVTHTQAGTMGPEQAKALVVAGADPSRTIVGHMCGNARDLDYQLQTLSYGVGIGFDRIGLNNMFNDITDDVRMDTLAELADRGYVDRIYLSQDSVNNWLGRDASGFHALPGAEHWKITRIGDYILPGLTRRGFTEADIEQILVTNIARLWAQE